MRGKGPSHFRDEKSFLESEAESLKIRLAGALEILGPLNGPPQDEPDKEGWWLYQEEWEPGVSFEQVYYLEFNPEDVRISTSMLATKDYQWDDFADADYPGRWLYLGDMGRFFL